MFALIALLAFIAYLVFSLIVISLARKWAKSHNYAVKKAGWIAFIIMAFPLLWDTLPVYALKTYHCNINAGFSLYKTLDQWKAENPGVAETLDLKQLPPEKYYSHSEKEEWSLAPTHKYYRYPSGYVVDIEYKANGYKETITDIVDPDSKEAIGYYLNPRFAWRQQRKSWWVIGEHRDQVIDLETGEVLAELVDFERGGGISHVSGLFDTLNALKFWLGFRSCDRTRHNRKKFSEYKHLIKYQEEIRL